MRCPGIRNLIPGEPNYAPWYQLFESGFDLRNCLFSLLLCSGRDFHRLDHGMAPSTSTSVADAEVSAVNEATGKNWLATIPSTNGSGSFYLPSLKMVQNYISFSVADFKTVEAQ